LTFSALVLFRVLERMSSDWGFESILLELPFGCRVPYRVEKRHVRSPEPGVADRREESHLTNKHGLDCEQGEQCHLISSESHLTI